MRVSNIGAPEAFTQVCGRHGEKLGPLCSPARDLSQYSQTVFSDFTTRHDVFDMVKRFATA